MLTPLELSLLDHYHVPRNDNEDFEYTCKAWIDGPNTFVNNNPIMAIKKGQKFDITQVDMSSFIQEAFGSYDPLFINVTEDVAKYPIRLVFINSYPELIKTVVRLIQESDSRAFFEEITGESSANFLNQLEMIFYIMHGYGRPNPNISEKDMEIRLFLLNSAYLYPTSLTVLNRFVRLCATNYSPRDISNKLSDTVLPNIPEFLLAVMKNIVQVLSAPDFSPVDLEELLLSYGMFPYGEYEPTEKVYYTNLTQIQEYSNVMTDRRFSFKEVRDRPDLFIKMYLNTLSDMEIINMTVTMENTTFALKNTLKLDTMADRERSHIIARALEFLTAHRFFVLNNKNIIYTRLVDSKHKKISPEELKRDLLKNQCFLCAGPMSPKEAQEIAKNISDPQTKEIIADLQELYDNAILHNRALLNKIPREFIASQLSNKIIPEAAKELLVYSARNQTLLSCTLGFYMDNIHPQYAYLLTDTLSYWADILGQTD